MAISGNSANTGLPAGKGGGLNPGEVWIWLARDPDGHPTPAAFECLHEGGALARRLGAVLVAVCDLPPDQEGLSLLAEWGVIRVRMLGQAQPAHPQVIQGASPLAPLLELERPKAVLFPADPFGMVAAPLLAAELDGEYVSGITGITVDGNLDRGDGRKLLVANRPVLGDQFEALVRCGGSRPVVATLAPGAVGEPSPPKGALIPGNGIPEIFRANEAQTGITGSENRVVDLIPPDPATVDLEDAERIVAFGRGAFTPEGLKLAESLADTLGAVVAGTRPAADEGWLPFSRQVGLTGAIVQPRLYVALGISGAPYHMVGIKEPRTLVAINSDPEAPIMSQAHLGIVGDIYAVVPALLERLARGESVESIAKGQGERERP